MAQKVIAPKRRPRVGGIKSIAGPFILEQRLTADTAFVWEDAVCDPTASASRAGCLDDVVEDVDFGDTTSGVTQYELIGPVFARFKAVKCFLGGDNDEAGAFVTQAQGALETVEDREVEKVLWDWAEAATDSDTAASLVEAIAAAEEYADVNYIGQPVLLMSRGASQTAFEKGALKRDGDVLTTGNGTPVLGTGVVPDDEQDTVVAIGWPAVYATPIVANTAPEFPVNQSFAIAQRSYGIGVDCDFRYAVSVTAP